MKRVKVSYYCDYCKQEIDTDSDTVRAILPGRIGFQDGFMADSEEEIRHYHDYCLEHLMTLEYQEEVPEPVQEEPVQEEVPEQKPKRNSKKDLGKLQSLLNAKWTLVKIADEFGVSEATIYNWINELKEREAV